MAYSDVQSAGPSAPLYPDISEPRVVDVTTFRLQKICDTQKTFENEIEHYTRVSKKYKRTQAVFQNTAVTTGMLSVILSSSSLASALTGIGVVVAAPLAGVSAVLGAISAVSTGLRKHFTQKVAKHENTVTLAQSKLNSVSELVSKALVDGAISDQEFSLIIREIEKYHEMKAEIRQRTKPIEPIKLSKRSEREKIKRELKLQVRKKLGSLAELN